MINAARFLVTAALGFGAALVLASCGGGDSSAIGTGLTATRSVPTRSLPTATAPTTTERPTTTAPTTTERPAPTARDDRADITADHRHRGHDDHRHGDGGADHDHYGDDDCWSESSRRCRSRRGRRCERRRDGRDGLGLDRVRRACGGGARRRHRLVGAAKTCRCRLSGACASRASARASRTLADEHGLRSSAGRAGASSTVLCDRDDVPRRQRTSTYSTSTALFP